MGGGEEEIKTGAVVFVVAVAAAIAAAGGDEIIDEVCKSMSSRTYTPAPSSRFGSMLGLNVSVAYIQGRLIMCSPGYHPEEPSFPICHFLTTYEA